MRTYILLPLAVLLFAACNPPSTDEPPPELGDPVELLDTWDGASFAELLEIEFWEGRDLVVFCSGVQGLNVYDVSDPSDMSFEDRTGFQGANPSFPRCQRVATEPGGERVYLVSHGDEVQPDPFISVVDASEPDSLRPLETHFRDETVEGLTVAGDYLLVAAHQAGLLVFERGAGGALTELGSTPLTNAWNVQAADSLAYVANGASGLAVVDYSDPQNPQVVAEVELPGTVKDVDIDGDRLFAALGEGGVGLLSLDDPRNPVLIEVEDTPGSSVALEYSGGKSQALYVADWNDIRVFDFQDRDDLGLIGREPVSNVDGVVSRVFGIAANDDVFFSCNWTEMVSFRYHPGLQAPDLYLSRGFLQLADSEKGMSRGTILARNEGTQPLRINRIGAPDELSIVGLHGPLEVGQQVIFEVLYDGSDSAWNGDVRIFTNDPDQPEQEVAVEINVPGITVGDQPPNFEFRDLDDNLLSLTDFGGAPVMLAYFNTF